MGPGHMLGAAAFTLGLGLAQIHLAEATGQFGPLGVGEVVAAAALAVPFSAGRFSPDADNRGRLKRMFGHRRALHWWGWPVVVLAALVAAGAPFVALGPALGWLSHIWPFDYLFGKGGRSIPKGIPRWPWRGSPRHGLGLRVSADRSWIERLLIGDRRKHSALEWIFTGVLFAVVAGELWLLGGTMASLF